MNNLQHDIDYYINNHTTHDIWEYMMKTIENEDIRIGVWSIFFESFNEYFYDYDVFKPGIINLLP